MISATPSEPPAAGIPLRTIMEWMGHKDIKTTMVYAHYSPSEREADLIQQAFKGSELPIDPGVLLEGEWSQSGPDPETTTASSGQLYATRSGTNQPPSS
jgi:hypothetical protein